MLSKVFQTHSKNLLSQCVRTTPTRHLLTCVAVETRLRVEPGNPLSDFQHH